MASADCDCDTANARLAIRLELEDIADFLHNSTDQSEIDLLTNRAATLRLHHQETKDFDSFLFDQRMQRSVYEAMLSDFPPTEALLQEEAASTALNLRNQGVAQLPELRVEGEDGYYKDERIDPRGCTTLAAYVKSLSLDEENDPRECYICMADVPYSITTEVGQCHHVWCRDCLVRMFELAAKNESNYPIRCCREVPVIPLDHIDVVSLVGAETIATAEVKIVEYETRDKTYCHDSRCSAFIAPDTINGSRAVCGACEKVTCSGCKVGFHEGECKTTNDEAFDEWRQTNGSATCNACRREIIISHGCNHMRFVDRSAAPPLRILS